MLVRELKLVYASGGITVDASSILTPFDSAALVREHLDHQPSETFLVVPMTTKYMPLGFIVAATGNLSYVAVEPSTIMRLTLLANAQALLVAHNHPSGDPTPSTNDIALTARLKAACALLDIDFIDHVIIGHHGRYTSLKELGHI